MEQTHGHTVLNAVLPRAAGRRNTPPLENTGIVGYIFSRGGAREAADG